ncbi:MAG: amidohydrolase family protein [Proteobacteria bacterium]|nr:amidohydrolase family protein [Pseudomonadota bacterium]
MKFSLSMTAAVLAFAASAASAQTTAITGATVHTVGPEGTLENATVVIENGQIAEIGTGIQVPAGAKLIDASGKIITPGLFSAMGQLGLSEVGAVSGTNDAVQRGDDFSAGFDVADAYNRRSVVIPISRIDGITRALIAPRAGRPDEQGNSSRVLSGLASVVQLGDSGNYLTRHGVAVVANLGETGSAVAAGSRAAAIQQLRAALADALDYRRNKAAYERGDWREYSVSTADLEALVSVVEGERSMIFNANRASDIEVVIKLASEFSLSAIIIGGAEAWMLANELAAAKVSVIIDGTANLPGNFDRINARLETGGILAAAGVRVAFGAGAQTHQARNITQSAGNAVANGMDWDAALEAITLAPAEMYGVDREVGSLEPGKSADLIIWGADPLELTSYPEQVFIQGESIPMESRQTLLRDRYLQTDTVKPPAFRH